MKQRYCSLLLLQAFMLLLVFTARADEINVTAKTNNFVVLCYHDVSNQYSGDPTGVSVDTLVSHLNWLRDNDYTAITVDDILAANAGAKTLPPRAYLLSFDDGYLSFYRNVYPVLKLLKLPSVIAVVTSWVDAADVAQKDSDDPFFKRQQFVTWPLLREMQDSGLVEVASHSHNLHFGLPSNPQGNTQPAGTVLRYLQERARYENEDALRERLRMDASQSVSRLRSMLGKKPRVMVWPFGAYNQIGIEESRRQGMQINFSLDTGVANAAKLDSINRVLIGPNLTLAQFSYAMRRLDGETQPEPIRGVRISLDTIADVDDAKENAKLGALMEQIKRLGVNTVFLDAYEKPRDGRTISRVYFPSAVVAMKRDLFNRASWQIRKRLGVRVFAVLRTEIVAIASSSGNTDETTQAAFRDLARHAIFQGIVIDRRGTAANDVTDLKKLIAQVEYYRKPSDALFEGIVIDTARTDAKSAAAASLASSAFVVAPESADKPTAFIQTGVPSPQKGYFSRAVTYLETFAQHPDKSNLVQSVRALERHGIRNVIVDDGGIPDDAIRFDWLRRALSVNPNPYQN